MDLVGSCPWTPELCPGRMTVVLFVFGGFPYLNISTASIEGDMIYVKSWASSERWIWERPVEGYRE